MTTQKLVELALSETEERYSILGQALWNRHLVDAERRVKRASQERWAAWAIAALAIFCTALGYVLYFRLIDHAGATNAMLVTLLVPSVAILLGGVFLGEHLQPQDFAGLALIALGLAAIDGRVLSALSGRRLLRQGA